MIELCGKFKTTMDMQEPVTSASERETLQEEIKRIQLALEGNYDDGSGDENGSNVSEDEDALNIDEDCEDNPNEEQYGMQVREEPTDLDHGIEEFEDGEIIRLGDRSGSGSLLGENAGYVASLALNRAYQEVIKDCLKRIEDLLTSNSEIQEELSHELEDRVLIRPNSVVSKKNQLSSYSVPYFKDTDGMHPPSNEDVRLKCARAEVRAHEMRPSIWKSSHKESLKKAVLNDAREKLLRPYMNRKEIEMEKLQAAQKATEECKFRLRTVELDEEEDGEEDENEEDSDEDWEDEHEAPKKHKVPRHSSSKALEKERQVELKEAQTLEKEVRKKIKAIDKELEEKKFLSETDLLKEMDPQKIDWLKISAFEFDGRWDSVACQQMWTNVLSPAINRSKWLKEENDHLLKLVKKYNKRNWPKIALELGTNRTPFQCLQHYEIKLNTCSHIRTWTPDEEALLLEVVATCRMGNNIPWTQVSFYMEDKSAAACQIRYNQMDPTQKRGRWSADEDALLLTQIHKYGPQQWALIANAVPNRTSAQCRERWSKALNPTIRLGQWSYDEDKLLLTLMKKENNSFARVAQQMTGRTNSQIRKRYNVLKRWEKEMVWLDHQSEETREFLLGRPPNIVLQSLQKMLVKRRRENSEDATAGGTVSSEAAGNSSGKGNLNRKGDVVKEPTESDYKPNKTERRDLSVLVQCSSLFFDYLRQQRDREAGELVVPRPLVSKHSTRRCIQRLKMKEKLRQAVLQSVGNTREEVEEAEEVHNVDDTATKDSAHPISGSSKAGLLKTLHPNMTVKEILEVTQSIAEDRKQNQDHPPPENLITVEDNTKPAKKKGRKTLSKVESALDNAIRQTLICQASAFTPMKKQGRRRRYFASEDSNIHLDPEKRRQCEARTTSILMKALKVDGQAAWAHLEGNSVKSELNEVVPVAKQDSIQRAKESLSQIREFGFLTTQTSPRNGDSQQAGTYRSDVAPSGGGESRSKGDNSRELPPLPPSWTTLAGFRALKLGLGGLVQKAANCSKSQIYSLKRKRSRKGDSPKNSDHQDEVVLVRNEGVQEDPLCKVCKTEEFQVLKSRFNALFLWPTFLSSVPLPEKQTPSQLVEDRQEAEGTQKTRKGRPRKRFNPRPKKKASNKKTSTANVKTEVDGDKTSEEEMSSTANHDRETCSRETTQTCTSDKSSVHIGKDSVSKRRRGRRQKLQQPTEGRRSSTRLASKCKVSETSETQIIEGPVSGAKGGKSSKSGSAHNNCSEDESVHNRILGDKTKINRTEGDRSVESRTSADESVNSGTVDGQLSNIGTTSETSYLSAQNGSLNHGVEWDEISSNQTNCLQTLNTKALGEELPDAPYLAKNSKLGSVGDDIPINSAREGEVRKRQISNSSSLNSLVSNSESVDTVEPESKKRKRGRPNKLATQKN